MAELPVPSTALETPIIHCEHRGQGDPLLPAALESDLYETTPASSCCWHSWETEAGAKGLAEGQAGRNPVSLLLEW